MSGAFQTSRGIFDSPIWKNIVDFRLFFLIYGQAVFSEEGVRLSDDLMLQRGQWCRSTRKIQEDLTYIENRQIKKYSTSVISRCIKRLVDMQMVCTKTHELGTVFTVVNYDKYQGFEAYKKDNLEQNLEQSGNSRGTVAEQSGNNNKKVKKEKNVKKVEETKIAYSENVTLTEIEYQNLCEKYGKELTDSSILYLSSYKIEKTYKTKSDNLTIQRWVVDAVKKTKVGENNAKKFEGQPQHGGTDNKNKSVTGDAVGWLPSSARPANYAQLLEVSGQ